MSSIREDLNSFTQFATQQLAAGDSSASLDELFMQWHDERAREEVNDAIRRGLADVDAGRHEPADRAIEAIRKDFGFSKQ